MTAKKSTAKKRKEVILKTDLSFEELINGAFQDKSFKKRESSPKKLMILTMTSGAGTRGGKKKSAKKAVKKTAKKSAAKKKK